MLICYTNEIKSMSDVIRDRITEFFQNNRFEEFSINDIATRLKIERDTASKHLSILTAEKILKKRTIANGKFFSLNTPNDEEIENLYKGITKVQATGKYNSPSLENIKKMLKNLKKENE